MTVHSPANVVAPVVVAAWLLTACGQPADNTLQGYVEGEYLYLAAPQSGYLKTLDAGRGSRVMVGQPVFALDTETEEFLLPALHSAIRLHVSVSRNAGLGASDR